MWCIWILKRQRGVSSRRPGRRECRDTFTFLFSVFVPTIESLTILYSIPERASLWGGRSCPLTPAAGERRHICCSAWIKKKSLQSPSALAVTVDGQKSDFPQRAQKSAVDLVCCTFFQISERCHTCNCLCA